MSKPWRPSFSRECGHPGEVLAQNERVDALSPLESAHRFQVTKVPNHMVVGQYASSSQDIARHPRYFHGLANMVQLSQRNLPVARQTLIHEAT